MTIHFTVPDVPEGKRRPRTRVLPSKGKGPPIVTIYSDPADVKREALIRSIAREAMQGQPAFTGPVRVTIKAYFEPPPSWSRKKREAAFERQFHSSKPDADNVGKSVLDGMMADPKARVVADRQPVCLIDDAQVADLSVVKLYGERAGIDVTVEALAPPLATKPD